MLVHSNHRCPTCDARLCASTWFIRFGTLSRGSADVCHTLRCLCNWRGDYRLDSGVYRRDASRCRFEAVAHLAKAQRPPSLPSHSRVQPRLLRSPPTLSFQLTESQQGPDRYGLQLAVVSPPTGHPHELRTRPGGRVGSEGHSVSKKSFDRLLIIPRTIQERSDSPDEGFCRVVSPGREARKV